MKTELEKAADQYCEDIDKIGSNNEGYRGFVEGARWLYLQACALNWDGTGPENWPEQIKTLKKLIDEKHNEN